MVRKWKTVARFTTVTSPPIGNRSLLGSCTSQCTPPPPGHRAEQTYMLLTSLLRCGHSLGRSQQQSIMLSHSTAAILGLVFCTLFVFVESNFFFSGDICCGDEPLVAESGIRCCGNSTYSTRSHVCCWDTAKGFYSIPLAEDIAGNVTSQRYVSCCGDTIFDYRFETCCDGSVLDRQTASGNTGCCGKAAFDPYTELCCDRHVIQKPSFTSLCCGSVAYDAASELCCQGNVLSPNITTIKRSLGRFDEHVSHFGFGMACCGSGAFDPSHELCCEGNAIGRPKSDGRSYECCGGLAYDWHNELCCHAKIFPRTSDNEACCGKVTYDTATHACCQDVVAAKNFSHSSSSWDNSSSLTQFFSFSPHSYFASEDNEATCCGNTTYNFDVEVCCQGVISPRGSSTITCCGSVAMDVSDYMCCDGKIIRRNLPSDDCCGSTSYDSKSKMCCQGVVQDATALNATGNPLDSLRYCCGNVTYDPVAETCCGGRKNKKQILV